MSPYSSIQIDLKDVNHSPDTWSRECTLSFLSLSATVKISAKKNSVNNVFFNFIWDLWASRDLDDVKRAVRRNFTEFLSILGELIL